MTRKHLGPVLQYIRTALGAPTTGDTTDADLLDRFATRREEAAFAARRVIVTAEEIVDERIIRLDPNRTLIPALVVIRKPEGAILSQVIREPDVALRDALVAYRKFYSTLLPYRSSFVVGEFNQVTRDFSRPETA